MFFIKQKLFLLLFVLVLTLQGCSSNGESKSEIKSSSKNDEMTSNNISNDKNFEDKIETQDRLIINRADVYVEVKKLEDFSNTIESQLKKVKGYIVNKSYSIDELEESKSGTIELRIPREAFHNFLDGLPKQKNTKVTNQQVVGEDVTEEYVDIASRLKAKEAVEDRLYQFMKQATKTKELLDISKELGEVQAEIESMKGRMEFLANQSDLSTITIMITENNLNKNAINPESLNTWEKTKHAFTQSIQGILQFFSSIIVFLFGRSPYLLLILIIVVCISFIFRRFRDK